MSTEKTVNSLVSQFNFVSMRAKEIAKSLLTRAVNEGREEKMMERITHHFNRAHDMPPGHEEGIAFARKMDELCGKSQSLRKMSIRDGRIYEDSSIKPLEVSKPSLTLH